jgi:EPS-associated MarR family transcriptional regulator
MDEAQFRILRHVEANPRVSQRELARALGLSLGKVNYCLNALIEAGCIKASNFRGSRNKLAYAYLLTPRGIEQKAVATFNFLRQKVAEYEALRSEIADLRREVNRRHGARGR